jgi:hypothetical protein
MYRISMCCLIAQLREVFAQELTIFSLCNFEDEETHVTYRTWGAVDDREECGYFCEVKSVVHF